MTTSVPPGGLRRVRDRIADLSLQANEYRLISWLFLRLLAAVYFVAFASLGVQIIGLAGSDGILPLNDRLSFVEEQHGMARFWYLPTLFWINSGDNTLQIAAIAGCLFSLALLFNWRPRLSALLLFVLYLSLFHAAQVFTNFQWDYLLLESGFLAIFLPSGSRWVVWLYRWLLFRLRFLSGASKIVSNDPSWANLTALTHYFETQPLPHWGSWYAHQFADWLLRVGTATTLLAELIIPLMMFLPRGPRFFAAWVTIAMQVVIMLTSNHNFFNLLTIVLCLFLFDDQALQRITPPRVFQWMQGRELPKIRIRPLGQALLGVASAFIVMISGFQMWEMLARRDSPAFMATLINQVRPFRIVNQYHVFPTMKTQRFELVVEGSQDGEDWKSYEFKYKPGAVWQRPQVIIPHQPRLDWMMWFVFPGDPVNLMWFEKFLHALLDNSPSVIALLEANPFSEEAPSFIRISVYRYEFTDFKTRQATGQWWSREYVGPFYPMPWIIQSSDQSS